MFPYTCVCPLIHTYTGILFSLKKRGNLSYATTQMNLEDVTLSDISQSQKDKYCMIPIYEVSKVAKCMKVER